MSSENQFLRIGKIVDAHGLQGRLKIIIITDISERFKAGTTLYLKINAEYFKEYKSIEFIEQPGRASLLKLKGIDNRDDALELKGIEIFIDKSDAEKTRDSLGEDSYYFYDIVGCSVFRNGEFFAEVKDIMNVGDGSILVLKNDEGKEFLIPFIESMVDTKEIHNRKIDINPIDGLFES